MVWTVLGWILVGIAGIVLGGLLLQVLVGLLVFVYIAVFKHFLIPKIKRVFKREDF